MTIPFYTLNIMQPLQQLLDDADGNGDWQPVINYCEPLIETTEDDGVILCYTFAIMEQALAIHIDDVEKTANECLLLLKKLQHTTGGTDHWQRMLKRCIKDAKKLEQADNKLLDKPYAKLSIKEKAKLAYNLGNKKGLESLKRAAEIHKELIEAHKGDHDESYHYGNYILCLYQSKQVVEANKAFDEFLTWTHYNQWQHYGFLVGNCFQQKILLYTNDAKMFQQIWNEAIQKETIIKHSAFPYAEKVQDELIIAADKLGLQEIKEYLIKLIIAERKSRMIPDEIKNIINTK